MKLFIFLLAIALTSCGTYKTINAKHIKEEQLAILDTKMSFLSPYIFVHSIDGESRGLGLYSNYLLAPGERVITVLGNSQLGLDGKPTNIVFIAEPASGYKLIYKEMKGSSDWLAEIINKDTGERVDTKQYSANCTYSFAGYKCKL